MADADGLVGDAAVEQLHGQVARLKGESAVLRGGLRAALGVADDGSASFDAATLALQDAGETLGVDGLAGVDDLAVIV